MDEATWAASSDARALFATAQYGGAAQASVALAACACARLALVHVAHWELPRRALVAMEALARGDATVDRAYHVATRDLATCVDELGRLKAFSPATYAVGAAHHATTLPCRPTGTVLAVAAAVSLMLRSASSRNPVAVACGRREANRRMAELVRAHVPWGDVVGAVDSPRVGVRDPR